MSRFLWFTVYSGAALDNSKQLQCNVVSLAMMSFCSHHAPGLTVRLKRERQ